MLNVECWMFILFRSTIPRKVRHLVLPETGARRAFHQFLIHRAGQVLVHVKFAGLQLREQRRVVLVNDFVGGQMLAAERQHLGQGRAPDLHRLTGNREHQVEVQIVKTGPAQDVERLEDHFTGVDAAEPFEQWFVE